MVKNYAEELKVMIDSYKDKGFEWGKPIEYLEFRNGISRAEMEKEILDYKNAEFVEKQKDVQETRYKIYFVYDFSHGRVYVLTFREKIRVITVYPIGKLILKNYKRKFKKE